jgi:two-component system, chemotaxis family, chemotaxis protein CheY
MMRIEFDKLRFLVIEDNPHMRRILKALLTGFGSREIYEAADGMGGIEAFAKFTPDIVIIDWAMPMLDGLDFVQMIRQPDSNASPFTPIIMLTGHSERNRVMAARDAGVTEFMVKPISANSLYRRILSVVASPRRFIKTQTYFGPDRRRSSSPTYTGPERRKGAKVDPDRLRRSAVQI